MRDINKNEKEMLSEVRTYSVYEYLLERLGIDKFKNQQVEGNYLITYTDKSYHGSPNYDEYKKVLTNYEASTISCLIDLKEDMKKTSAKEELAKIESEKSYLDSSLVSLKEILGEDCYNPSIHGAVTSIIIYEEMTKMGPEVKAELYFAHSNSKTICWTNIDQRNSYSSGINGYTYILDERPQVKSICKLV